MPTPRYRMNALFRFFALWFYRFLRVFGVETPTKPLPTPKQKEQTKEKILPKPSLDEILANLTEADTKLYLSDKGITNQDLQKISTYTYLEVLHLDHSQITDITPLQKLTNLQKLVLWNNQITDITPLQKLTNLRELLLDNNQITDIKPLQTLINLHRLRLQNNQITDITPLQKLINLKKLILVSNQITHISLDFLNALPHLKELYLYGNPIQNLPKEVFDKKENVLPEVRAYLESIQDKRDRRELNEAKLIIIGVGDVGKTEIVEALSAEDYTFHPNRQTTKGIRIKQWTPKECRRAGEEVPFTAHIWDFAGQEINYGTHQFFLTKNSVYIFVWETRKGEKESKFEYWLQVVSLLSDNAPILVVQNKVDIYEDEINQRDWKSKFPHIIDFYKTSCKTGKGIEALREAIVTQLTALPNTQEIWNKDWYAVRTQLEQSPEDYITHKEYRTLCEQKGLPAHHAESLGKQLHDIGVILHFEDDMHLSDTVVLKTDWATDAAYCLLDNKKVLAGRFQQAQLHSIWAEARFAGKFPFLLRLMERFELVFKLQDKDEYIVPEGLPIDAPKSLSTSLPLHLSTSLRFEYHYQFMPKGILSRLICRMHRLIAGEIFWRYGVVLQYNKTTQALVRLNDVEEILSIAVQGAEAETLLQIIRQQVQDVHATLNNPPLNEKVPCVCAQCKDSKKPYLHDYQTLLFFKEKHRQDNVCAKSAEDVPIDALLKGIKNLKDSANMLEQMLFRRRVGNARGCGKKVDVLSNHAYRSLTTKISTCVKNMLFIA
ncbi:MAG: hypothetical protein EAZ95_18335 [Bacteroidetes bacterium]|nr:MAG: hypothetical protein EAZ95_18335 [Bacteroidota bacterium]